MPNISLTFLHFSAFVVENTNKGRKVTVIIIDNQLVRWGKVATIRELCATAGGGH